MMRKGENIYERKDGRFEGRYIVSRDEEGKAKYASVYGQTKEKVRELLKAAKQENGGEKFLTNRLFSDVSKLWLEEFKGSLSPTSIPRYEMALSLYVLPFLKDRRIKDIDEDVLDEMLIKMRDKGSNRGNGGGELRGNTLKLALNVAKRVVEYANEKDFPKERKNVDIPKWNSESLVKPLSPEEQERVCLAAKLKGGREMLAVLYALYMGIGLGEVSALCCDDIHLYKEKIYIHQSAHRVRNTNEGSDKKTILKIMELPIKSRIRSVTIPEELLDYTRKFIKPGTLILSGKKDTPMDIRVLENRVEAAFNEMGIKGVNFQRILKTFKKGEADSGVLHSVFESVKENMPPDSRLDRPWLLDEMSVDLCALRTLIGLRTAEMADYIGVPEQIYLEMEWGRRRMRWDEYMAFLFFFQYNEKTEPVVESLGLYPMSLKRVIEAKG